MDTLEAQLALVPLVSNFCRNVRALNRETATPGLLRSRAELLERYWARFQTNHLEIQQDPRLRENDYITQNVFSTIELEYSDALGHIYDQQLCVPAVGRDVVPLRPAAMTSHLPRIQLPTFSGRREDWEAFRDMFRSLIHQDPALNDVQKLHFLKSSLQGEARKAVDNLPVTEGNYSIAWDRLLSRFDSSRLLAEGHLRALLGFPTLREEDASGLQSVLDELVRRRDALEKLDRPIEHWDDWFILIAKRSMDPETYRAWEMHVQSQDAEPTFKALQAFLQTRVSILLATETKSRPRKSAVVETQRRPPARHHARVMVATAEAPHCVPCNTSHNPNHCQELRRCQPGERMRHAFARQWCLNCLETGHVQRTCPSSARCSSCNSRHHRLLHTGRTSSKRAAPRPDQSNPKRHRSEVCAATSRANPPTPPDVKKSS